MKRSKKKIALVFGTRPEIIKLSGIIRHLQADPKSYFMIHTGQHYSYEMDRLFFRELELPEPKYQLTARSKGNRHGDHTGRMMTTIEDILLKERPDAVLVQGDTNSVLAGCLVSAKITGIRLGHVEAGLRSYDRAMPEEVNRIIADHVSDYLFPPTRPARQILMKEGIDPKKIHVTGNTIVDAVYQNLALARRKVSLKKFFPENHPSFFLMTMHRQENVDDRGRLEAILRGVGSVSTHFKTPIFFPIHPRTQKKIKDFNIKMPAGVQLSEPVGFLDFLRLEEASKLILTDSGGVQEEACILGVPCVTLRTTTERPETVSVGGNVIAGFDPKKILQAAIGMTRRRHTWKNPFGDGRASKRIVTIVRAGG